MKLTSIEIEGFGSIIAPFTYYFDKSPVTIIEGRNGAGKTTIFNAVSWAAYGRLIKPNSDFRPWPWVTSETSFLGTKVVLNILDRGSKYQITRCDDYMGKILNEKGGNKLIVLKEGNQLDQYRGKRDVQGFIENELIGYTFELFKNAVLFGQEVKRLNSETGPEKKKIFDDAFGVSYISKAKDLVSKRKSKNEELMYQQEIKVQSTKNLINNVQITLDEYQKAKDNFAEEQRKALQDICEEVHSFTKQITQINEKYLNKAGEITERINKYQKKGKLVKKVKIQLEMVKNNQFKYEMEKNGLENEIESLKARLIAIKGKPIKTKCDECGQPLKPKSVKKVKENRKKQIGELQEQITGKLIILEPISKNLITIEDSILGLEKKENRLKLKYVDKLVSLQEELGQINSKLRDAEFLQSRIEDREIEKAKIEARKLQIDEEGMKNKLEEFNMVLFTQSNELNSLKKSVEIDSWLIKDPLSNSGLKAFIFDSMLRTLNTRLRDYSKSIGMRVNVYIDMKSANKDIMISVFKKKQEVPYDDLSRGQKQLCDAALAFGINDTLTESKPINILLMDEIFESLDSENVEVVGQMIINKSKHKNIHVITHNRLFSPKNSVRVYLGLSNSKTEQL